VVREALHIAYAPAAYYRPWQAVYAGATVDQQRWLNTALLRQRRLPLPASLQAPDDPLARRLIGLWPRLPQVATLMGAARLRDWVPAQRGCAALPATVQAFMRAGYGDDRPVERHQPRREQALIPAEQHKGSACPHDRCAVVAAKVRNRLEVGREPTQKPHHLDIARTLTLQPTRRAHLVQVAINI